jgi:hypothetical protein
LKFCHPKEQSALYGLTGPTAAAWWQAVVVNRRDLNQAAKSLRLVVEKTTKPDDSLRESQLQDRLNLSADVLQALAINQRP